MDAKVYYRGFLKKSLHQINASIDLEPTARSAINELIFCVRESLNEAQEAYSEPILVLIQGSKAP